MQGLTTRGAAIASRDTNNGDLACHLSLIDDWLKMTQKKQIHNGATAPQQAQLHHNPDWSRRQFGDDTCPQSSLI